MFLLIFSSCKKNSENSNSESKPTLTEWSEIELKLCEISRAETDLLGKPTFCLFGNYRLKPYFHSRLDDSSEIDYVVVWNNIKDPTKNYPQSTVIFFKHDFTKDKIIAITLHTTSGELTKNHFLSPKLSTQQKQEDKIKIEVELNPDKPIPKTADLLKEEFKPLSEEEMKKLSKKLMENAQETFEEEK